MDWSFWEKFEHKKYTGRKCADCDKMAHVTYKCICKVKISFCNDCQINRGYSCGQHLRNHLWAEHTAVDLC